jgi:hypothetical protein
MTARLRKFALTAHVTSSVGWLGAIAAFLGLGIIGLTSQDAQTVRGAYLVMEPAAWYVLVPLALASSFTGILVSLGTPWGLFRHYWVLFKLLITVFATAILLIYMGTFRYMAGAAADPSADLSMVRNPSPVLHSVLALLVLLVATVLAVYKPRGMTPYGWRKQRQERAAAYSIGAAPPPTTRTTGDVRMADPPPDADTNRDTGDRRRSAALWIKASAAIVIVLVLLFVVLHLTGRGLGALHGH